MKKPYIFHIEVSAKFPTGKKIRLSNSTFRGVGIANVPNAKAVLEERAIEQIRSAYLQKWPMMGVQVTAKSTRINQDFLIVEGMDDPYPETQTANEDEQTDE
jgi:hypothetical protein